VQNRLVFAVQAICVVLAAVALYELKYPRQWGVGMSTDKALALFSGKDFAYERSARHQDGTADFRTKGPPLKYNFNRTAYGDALAAIDRGDLAKAEHTLQDILAKTPDEVHAAQGLGTVLYLQRRYEESATAFRKLLEQQPQFGNARVGLATALAAQGRYTDSIEQYSLAIGDDPTFALSYYSRGLSYYSIGKRVEAEADMKRTLDLLPATADLATMAREKLATLAKESAATGH
jgi:superkiller protein 3